MAPERLRILIEFWPKELEPHLTILATLWLRSPGQVGVGGGREGRLKAGVKMKEEKREGAPRESEFRSGRPRDEEEGKKGGEREGRIPRNGRRDGRKGTIWSLCAPSVVRTPNSPYTVELTRSPSDIPILEINLK